MKAMRSRFAAKAVRLAFLGVLAASLGLAAPLEPAPAYADSCTYKDVSYYPGSTTGANVRYGEVEVRLTICGSNTDDWSATESHWRNSTGAVLGFKFDSVRVVETGTGHRPPEKEWELRITAKSCPPATGYICSRSMGFTAPIKVTMAGNGNYRWNHHTTEASGSGTALYRTP